MFGSKAKMARGKNRFFDGSGTEMADDNSTDQIGSNELMEIADKQVTEAQLWERPLEGAGKDVLQVVGAVHQGVVVVLSSGAKYIVHKGVDSAGNGVTIVSKFENMGPKWEKVRTKKVSRSKLKDYVSASGSHYNLATDNCIHTANRMMALN